MAKVLAPSVDLDRLLAIAAERGCACNKIFIGPCLVHYAEAQRDGGSASRGFVGKTNQEVNSQYAQSDSRTVAKNSPLGSSRPRADTAVRGDRRGNKDRPASLVRKGPGRKW